MRKSIKLVLVFTRSNVILSQDQTGIKALRLNIKTFYPIILASEEITLLTGAKFRPEDNLILMAIDVRDDLAFLYAGRAVKEARRNDQINIREGELPLDADRLLMKLIHQSPNRIYFNNRGQVCRVLMFSEPDRRIQAKIQIEEPDEEGWKTLKGEVFSCSKEIDLERQISWFRGSYGMNSQELLSNPSAVFKRQITLFGSDEYVHVADASGYPLYYVYSINLLPLREQSLVLGKVFQPNPDFQQIDQVPQRVLDHTRPFSRIAVD